MDTWKYILVTLRLIEWTDKKTGEEQSCYAYSSGSSSTCTVFGSKTSASLSIRVGGERVNAPSSDVTLWMNDMTDEEFQLYRDAGNLQAYIAIQGDMANPSDSKVISVDEYNAIDSPSMLFQTA